MELNNREWAALIWLLLALGWVLSRREVRHSMGAALEALMHFKILIPLIAMIAYVAALARLGWLAGLWNVDLVKGTIIWFAGSAFVLLLNLNKAWEEPRFFRRTALRTLELTVFIAFFMNLFVFNFIAELILQPFLALLVMLSVVATREPRHEPVKKLVETLLAVAGFAVAFFTIVQLFRKWGELEGSGLLLDFALPVWMTLGILPFIYLVALYAAYGCGRRASKLWRHPDRAMHPA